MSNGLGVTTAKILGLSAIMIAFILVCFLIWHIICCLIFKFSLFKKLELHPGLCFIPIVNDFLMLSKIRFPIILWIFSWIVSSYYSYLTYQQTQGLIELNTLSYILPLICLIIYIYQQIKLGKAFNKSIGFIILLIIPLTTWIGMIILNFGNDTFIYAEHDTNNINQSQNNMVSYQ